MINEFPIFFVFLRQMLHFSANFDELLSGFRDKFQKRVTCVTFFFENKKRKLPKRLKSVKMIHYYSLLFIIIHREEYTIIIHYYLFVSLLEPPRAFSPPRCPRANG